MLAKATANAWLRCFVWKPLCCLSSTDRVPSCNTCDGPLVSQISRNGTCLLIPAALARTVAGAFVTKVLRQKQGPFRPRGCSIPDSFARLTHGRKFSTNSVDNRQLDFGNATPCMGLSATFIFCSDPIGFPIPSISGELPRACLAIARKTLFIGFDLA